MLFLDQVIERVIMLYFCIVCFRADLDDLSSEDEAVATDLDLHALILSSSIDTYSPEEPLKTAEEILREIDDIMQESPSTERSPDSDMSLLNTEEAFERSREVLGSPLHEKSAYEDRLFN